MNLPSKNSELINKRTESSKTFLLDNGHFKVYKSISGTLHYKDDYNNFSEEWKDIKLNIISENNYYEITDAPYRLKVFKDNINLTYSSKRKGTIKIKLKTINDISVEKLNLNINLENKNNELIWSNIIDGLDIKIKLKRAGISVLEIIKDSNVSAKLEWDIVRDSEAFFNLNTKTEAIDSENRKVKIQKVLDDKSDDVMLTLSTDFENQVAVVKDKNTRIKTWSSEVSFPIIYTAFNITEYIIANNDDGTYLDFGGGGGWYPSYFSVGIYWGIINHCGIRFQGLDIPQGATIVSADLKLYLKGTSGGTLKTKMYGDNVDNAAPWSSGDPPQDITKTIANVAWTPTGTGWITLDATSIVQEIINRGGWTSGNNIRFGILDAHTVSPAFAWMYDYNEGTGKVAVLEVEYDAGGSTSSTSSTTSSSSSSTSSSSSSTSSTGSTVSSSSSTSSTGSTVSSSSSTSSTSSTVSSSSSTSSTGSSSSSTSSTSSTVSSSSSTSSTSSTTTTSTTTIATTTLPVFDLNKYRFTVELIHSSSKYKENKVVLSSTVIQGKEFWDSEFNTYIVFPNPKFTDNLSVRVTMDTPLKSLVVEEGVTNVEVADELEKVDDIRLASIPDTPDDLITKSVEKKLIPKLKLDFTGNSPLVSGVDLSYSGGGGRLLLKDGTYTQQAVDTLIPGIVELADAKSNKVDPRLVSSKNEIPTGWTINANKNLNYNGSFAQKYTFANNWICKIFNFEGYISIHTPIYPIGNLSYGMIFGGYFTLTSDVEYDLNSDNDDYSADTVDSFIVSLIFYDDNNILDIIDKNISTSSLNSIDPISSFVEANIDQIPANATKVSGRIKFGELTSGNNVTLTMELPQLVNTNVVTYPIIRNRKSDILIVSNRNIKTTKGSVACEFISTHNQKCYYFDSRRNNEYGFAGYFNGGKLGFIINNGVTDYEIQTKWRQEWYASVLDKDIEVLPTSPTIGDRYLIFINNPSLGSKINQIAEYTNYGWVYTVPIKGGAVWISDESKAYVFNGIRWVYFDAEEEGKSSVAFTWDYVNSVRNMYGNGILLYTDQNSFNVPIKTNRILIGCNHYGLLHINTKIIKFIISEYTNPKFD